MGVLSGRVSRGILHRAAAGVGAVEGGALMGGAAGDAGPGRVTFGLLGAVTAYDATGTSLALGSTRRRAVLAALLVQAGRTVPVDQLVDMLWPGVAPPTASTMVHGAIAGLRRAVAGPRGSGEPPLLLTRGGGYALQVRPEQLDASRFETLLAEGRRLVEGAPARAAPVLAEALGLWRGPALDGLEEGFARDAAVRLDELRVQCAELRVDAELGLGRHHEVVADLEALVAAHPLREGLRGRLMVALYRCGRQSEALETYRAVRRRLAADLGLEPGPHLRRLEREILRQSGDLELRARVEGRRPGSGLPAPVSTFIGRARERDEVAALLGTHRLVTLTGPGGSGKTRLALEVAGRLADGGAAEAFLVDLTPLTASALFDETLAAALGVHAEPGQALTATIAAALSGRDTLIVLDNCEHLVEDCAAFVQAVLARVGRMRLLATSRERLGVPGEQVHPVRPLGLAAEHDDWRRIASCEAVRLFAERAAAARPGFAVTADNARLVLDVCRRLDGLPLALELAAARAASMPLRDLADRLDNRFRLLDSATRTADPRHRSLAATVAWSHDLLATAERVLLTRVAVFPAAFGLDAAEAVAGGGELVGADVARLLSRLVACSTVQLDEGVGGEMRYHLLETTRRFARERLADGELPLLRERHARHYLVWATESGAHLFGADSAPWLARLHRESDNFRSALEWSFGRGGDPESGAQLVGCLWHYWDLRGARDEGLHWVHAGLDAVGADRPSDRLPLLSAGALMHLGRAEFEASAVLAGEQLRLARTTGERAWEGDALAMEATVEWARARFDRARQLYEDAVEASIAGGDLWRAAMAEAQLARLHRDRNEPDAARAVAVRSLAHADEVGEELARGLAVDVLASLEHRWGDVSEARRLVEEALGHYRLVGYREGEASALHLAGRIALAARERAPARAAFGRSLELCRRIGHRAGTAAALEGLAGVATAGGDDRTAAGLLADAAALRAEIGVPLPTRPLHAPHG
ncbi:MAG: ATPase-like protein [Pseudonocardia sp.]|nr:ATPase-like protein [Pseudonocardia sp.]